MDYTGSTVKAAVSQKINEIYLQREEIIEAFIAKYGFEPERAVQVEQRADDGTSRWFIHRRTDEEMFSAAHDADKIREMAYRLARHMRNTDVIEVSQWAAQSGEILAELRAMDQDAYEAKVKS